MISPKSNTRSTNLNLYPLINLRWALKCNNQARAALFQVFLSYLSNQKQTWHSLLFLQDAMTTALTASITGAIWRLITTTRFQPATLLWRASGGPYFNPIIPGEQVDVCWWAPLLMCSLFLCGVWGTLCQADHPSSVGPSQSWFHHSLQ